MLSNLQACLAAFAHQFMVDLVNAASACLCQHSFQEMGDELLYYLPFSVSLCRAA